MSKLKHSAHIATQSTSFDDAANDKNPAHDLVHPRVMNAFVTPLWIITATKPISAR